MQFDPKTFEAKMKEQEEWFATLSDIDKLNYGALLELPNAVEVIAKLPADTPEQIKYKDMATFSLAVIRVLEMLGDGTGDVTGIES